jgi:hypothetical protein
MSHARFSRSTLVHATKPELVLIVDTETPAPCLLCAGGELRMSQMDQCRVITALQVDLRLCLDAVVDNDIKPIALAGRRNGALSAVFEQLLNFLLGCQSNIEAKPPLKIGQADVV